MKNTTDKTKKTDDGTAAGAKPAADNKTDTTTRSKGRAKAPSPSIPAKPAEIIERGKGWKLLTTGLVLDNRIKGEAWLKLGLNLVKRHSGTTWAIGDHLNYGMKFATKYAQGSKNTGITYQGLRDICWVCNNVGLSRRRDDLSFGHHREVASLKPQEQVHWLEEAAKHEWTVGHLRRRLRHLKLKKQIEDGIPRFRTVNGIIVAFHKWARYKKRTPHGPDAFAATLTTQEAKDCRDKLKPANELYEAIAVRLKGGAGKGSVNAKAAPKGAGKAPGATGSEA